MAEERRAIGTPGAIGENDAVRLRTQPPLPLWRHMLGAELRRLRHERGDTLGVTASRAGVSPQYLSEMERGVKDPSSEMIEAVAGALGVTLVDLARAVADELGAVHTRAERVVAARSSIAAGPSGAVRVLAVTSNVASQTTGHQVAFMLAA